MCRAQIFWEYGKYSIVAILLVSILRSGHLRGFALPIHLFRAAAAVDHPADGKHDLGRIGAATLSFNSGPLALTLVRLVLLPEPVSHGLLSGLS